MFNENIAEIDEEIYRWQNFKNEKIKEQIEDVFKKIKNDKEYE